LRGWPYIPGERNGNALAAASEAWGIDTAYQPPTLSSADIGCVNATSGDVRGLRTNRRPALLSRLGNPCRRLREVTRAPLHPPRDLRNPSWWETGDMWAVLENVSIFSDRRHFESPRGMLKCEHIRWTAARRRLPAMQRLTASAKISAGKCLITY
jgi:hypothetical protein